MKKKSLEKKQELPFFEDDEVQDEAIDEETLPESPVFSTTNPVPKKNIAVTAHQGVPFIPEDELLEHNLSRDMEQDSTIKTVSKELFSSKDIDLKTEVSHNEINQIVKLNFLKARWQVDNIEVLTDSFLRLRVSKERKSRREFVETVQLENKNAQGGGWMSKLFGGGGGGNP